MKYRTLGKTGYRVSEIGFGAWGIGGGMWQGGNDEEALRALHLAADRGLNFIDTALAYNEGHSERLIAKLVNQRKERMYVATKIPPKNGTWPARPGTKLEQAFPAAYIISCTEKSLKNLGVECLDLQQFHVWTDEWAGLDEWKRAVETLKRDGKVSHFGISINDHQPSNGIGAAGSGLIDTFQVIYNIFDQSPEDELFDYCANNNIGIIVRVPFDEGGLTGNITPQTVFPRNDFRNRYFRDERRQEIAARNERLRPFLGAGAKTLPELALRFCLSHPAVSTVIAGMRTAQHVEANCAVSDGVVLESSVRKQLQSHRWVRSFYDPD